MNVRNKSTFENNVKCWNYGMTGHIMKNCSASKKKEEIIKTALMR